MWLAFPLLMSFVTHCFSALRPRITKNSKHGRLKQHWFIISHNSVRRLGFYPIPPELWLGSSLCVQLGAQLGSTDRDGFSPLSTTPLFPAGESNFSRGCGLPRKTVEAARLLKTWAWKSKNVTFATSPKTRAGSREHPGASSLESGPGRWGGTVEGRLWRLVTTPIDRGNENSVTR